MPRGLLWGGLKKNVIFLNYIEPLSICNLKNKSMLILLIVQENVM